MHIALYIFWKSEVWRFQNREYDIEKVEGGKIRQFENEEFEAFERVIIFLLYTFFEKIFPTDESH